MKSALVVCVLALCLPLAAEARTGATPGRGGAGADPGRPGADHLRPGELPLARADSTPGSERSSNWPTLNWLSPRPRTRRRRRRPTIALLSLSSTGRPAGG